MTGSRAEPLGRRIAASLGAGSWGRPLFALASTGSTMDDARELAAAGAPAGTAVVAVRQRRGRGRRGRRFVSPAGGLYLTVIGPVPEPCTAAPRAGLVAALVTAETLGRCGAAVQLVWPNDLYQGRAKVGGLLAELWTPSGAAPRLLLGIGLNLGPDPSRHEPAAAGPAGPLRGLELRDPVADLAARLLRALPRIMDRAFSREGWPDILESLRGRLEPGIGARIRVTLPGGARLMGVAQGFDEEGALLLQDASGRRMRLLSGDVALLSREGDD